MQLLQALDDPTLVRIRQYFSNLFFGQIRTYGVMVWHKLNR